MHNSKWVHCDIKPNNIVFNKSHRIDNDRILIDEEKVKTKIIDFGLSTRIVNDIKLSD